MGWIEIAGWLGALFTAGAYSMRDMKLLRTVAVASNLSFITYGFAAAIWPMLALHLFLLPLNLYRLSEILAVAKRLRQRRDDGMPIDVLRPFVKPVTMDEGSVLFRRGNAPDHIYFLEEGEVELPELGQSIGPGTLFGEMAYFSIARTRTTSAICRTQCRILSINETDFMRLFHLNPEFGLYVIRLIAQRLVDGSREHSGYYSDFAKVDT